MNEIAERFRRRADAFEALIEGTPPDRWANASPCAGWTASDIVKHVLVFPTWGHPESVLASFREKARIDAPPDPDGRTRAAAFRSLRRVLLLVLDDPATPPDVVAYLDSAFSFDLAQHWWDLAKATGQDATIDPDEVDFMWNALSPLPASWWKWPVDNGHYAPSVPVADDASLQDRFLGLIGRDPYWTA